MVALVQAPATCEDSAGNPCDVVSLDPQQLQILAEHMQANTMYESTFLAFILLVCSGLMIMYAFSGRG